MWYCDFSHLYFLFLLLLYLTKKEKNRFKQMSWVSIRFRSLYFWRFKISQTWMMRMQCRQKFSRALFKMKNLLCTLTYQETPSNLANLSVHLFVKSCQSRRSFLLPDPKNIQHLLFLSLEGHFKKHRWIFWIKLIEFQKLCKVW